MIGEAQEPRSLRKILDNTRLDRPEGAAKISDFHLLSFVHSMGVLSKVSS